MPPVSRSPSRPSALIAYALSAATTLLWVGCVLPAGRRSPGEHYGDATTPFFREGLLMVPAVLLLVLLPVGGVLTRRFRGGLALLASTDAFIALYAAAAILIAARRDETSWVASGLLFILGALSIWETVRATRATHRPQSVWTRGLRLAICLLVLMVPANFLIKSNVERASLLAPFLVIGVSAAGAHLAQTISALRFTSAVIQVALAAHLAIALRYTIFRSEPAIESLSIFGWVTSVLAWVVVGLAVLQALAISRERRRAGLTTDLPPSLGGAGET